MKTKHEILIGLQKLGARITGSFADGTDLDGWSDYDFYVPAAKFKKAMALLEGCRLESCTIGHIATKDFFPWVEISYLFHHRKNRKSEVSIEGVVFKTW